jgi:hypothetical protein
MSVFLTNVSAFRSTTSRTTPEDDDVRDTSLSRRGSFISQSFGGGRTWRVDDKIIETSVSRRRLRNDVSRMGKSKTVVQDSPNLAPVTADETFEIDDRARQIAALLLRRESRELFDSILITDNPSAQRDRLGIVLLASHDMLDSFSRLVIEGALTVADGRLQMTPLMERIVTAITENTKS